MIRKSTILIALAGFLFIFSCKDRPTRVRQFVGEYNEQTSRFSNNVIESTKAEAFGDTLVRIEFVTTMEDGEGPMWGSVPTVIGAVIGDIPEVRELIDENVKFEISLLDSFEREITSARVDKNNIDRLKSEFKTPQTAANSHLSQELQLMQDLLKRELPKKDQDGNTITSIVVDKEMALTYVVVADEKYKAILSSPNAGALIKQGLMRDPSLTQILASAAGYGVKQMVFDYRDQDNKPLLKINLSPGDFR